MTRAMKRTDSEIHSFSHWAIMTWATERTDGEIHSFSHWASMTRALKRTDRFKSWMKLLCADLSVSPKRKCYQMYSLLATQLETWFITSSADWQIPPTICSQQDWFSPRTKGRRQHRVILLYHLQPPLAQLTLGLRISRMKRSHYCPDWIVQCPATWECIDITGYNAWWSWLSLKTWWCSTKQRTLCWLSNETDLRISSSVLDPMLSQKVSLPT